MGYSTKQKTLTPSQIKKISYLKLEKELDFFRLRRISPLRAVNLYRATEYKKVRSLLSKMEVNDYLIGVLSDVRAKIQSRDKEKY